MKVRVARWVAVAALAWAVLVGGGALVNLVIVLVDPPYAHEGVGFLIFTTVLNAGVGLLIARMSWRLAGRWSAEHCRRAIRARGGTRTPTSEDTGT